MWILPLIGYAGAIVGFGFLTLAIASGLYYLSELVEEHTVIAKRLLTRTIYTVIGVQVTLWIVDGFPFWATALGIVSHVVYLGNMRRFPFVKLSDPLFLLSCGKALRLHPEKPAVLNTFSSPRPRRSLRLVPPLLRRPSRLVPPRLIL